MLWHHLWLVFDLKNDPMGLCLALVYVLFVHRSPCQFMAELRECKLVTVSLLDHEVLDLKVHELKVMDANKSVANEPNGNAPEPSLPPRHLNPHQLEVPCHLICSATQRYCAILLPPLP